MSATSNTTTYKFRDTAIYETCVVCKDENMYMYASIPGKSREVSLCSLKCLETFNALRIYCTFALRETHRITQVKNDK